MGSDQLLETSTGGDREAVTTAQASKGPGHPGLFRFTAADIRNIIQSFFRNRDGSQFRMLIRRLKGLLRSCTDTTSQTTAGQLGVRGAIGRASLISQRMTGSIQNCFCLPCSGYTENSYDTLFDRVMAEAPAPYLVGFCVYSFRDLWACGT